MTRGGGTRKQLGAILYLRALQGHSGRNPIDPSQQDNVLIPNDFFEYNCHIGCAINLHSITNSGLIPGGQKDPKNIDLAAPRLAWHKQKKWKKHQNTMCSIDIKLAQKK